MYLVYQCPNQFCKEQNHEIWSQKSVEFVNPFNHWISCIANGNAVHLYMVYEQNKESKQLYVPGTFFQPSMEQLIVKELALNNYIQFIS